MDSLRRELVRALEEAGCRMVREGKKHEVWASPKTPRPFTIPRSLKSRHTANAILKQAGLAKRL